MSPIMSHESCYKEDREMGSSQRLTRRTLPFYETRHRYENAVLVEA